jgi:MSHA pilin protein MshC
MSVKSSDPHALRGFTMVELTIVIVLVGVLAAFVMPKVMAALSIRDGAWHDEVLSTMRYAQKSSVAHRRLVCASVGSASITLTMAAANPATTCGSSLLGMDGSAAFASTSNSSAATTVSPAGDGKIYFQPDGRVTSDGAGNTALTRTISMSGADDVTVNGETGHVE